MPTTMITSAGFMLDGQPFRIFSGAIHYFRVHPDLWHDRLVKLKAMGLNTVETYVAWNLHEPQPGQFDFSGFADIVKFLQTAHELGLKAIVRPGPYICAEWEFGGLPGWLLNIPGLRLRCRNRPYLEAAERFYGALLPRLRPLLYSAGGPIIAMQIENEYGSYGNDKDYLEALRQMFGAHRIDVVHFTSDGGCDHMLQGGTLPEIWKTVNFGSRPQEQFDALRRYQPDLPLMCMEFWNGWFDHWTEPHHTRDETEAVDTLKQMLSAGANVNFYMFHGGTNFGFFNGANCSALNDYQPTVTSYDYDSPLSECGDPTPKYSAFRKILAQYNPDCDAAMPVPASSHKAAYGPVALTGQAGLLDNLTVLGRAHRRATPDCMESFGQNYGFILYRHRLRGPLRQIRLTVQEPRDRAQVFLGSRPLAVFYRNDAKCEVVIDVPADGGVLEILVENLGRANYGSLLEDNRKGISTGVRLDGQFLFGWEIFPLPLEALNGLRYFECAMEAVLPTFYRGELTVDVPADTFLKIPGGHKGVCWINGFNLGRYWKVGPQKTMYVPAPLLRTGVNTIEVLELQTMSKPEVVFTDTPEL